MATSMAAATARFESTNSIEERKEQTQNARAEVLRTHAKANFEKEERNKELKRLQGEDTWMLPDEHSMKKKKKKDKARNRNMKKKKKNNESSHSSSSSEDEWVEAVPSRTPDKEKAWKVKDEKSKKDDTQIIKRDEWMTVDFMSVKTQEKAQALEQSKLKERELNIGTGLPPKNCSVWLRKSYLRMKEQAEKQNRNFEDIVAERYGSMEIFHLKLEDAKKAWRKPKYSDKAQNSQESRKSALVKYDNSSRDRYATTDTAKNSNDYKFIGDEKDKIPGSLETYRRESNPRQNQEFSSGNLRAKFLRSSDDEELSFHSKGRKCEPSSSSSALVAQGSLHSGFRKPTENSEERLTWSHSDGRGDKKQSNQKPLETKDMRQKSQEEEHEYIHILSADEKNKLGAKIMKAEMMGDMELAEQLKAQLQKANKFKETNEDQQEVILVRTDQSGREWPVNTAGKSLESQGGRRKTQMLSIQEEKERARYFHDDDNLSLNDLVKNEKMGTAENPKQALHENDMFVSKAAERECLGEEEENQWKKAIAEHWSLAAQMEKCLYCLDSSQFPKHLIVSIDVKVYLCLPNVPSLTEGHCLIVPLQHHKAVTLLDEGIWEEIQMFRKSLVKMFENKGLDCIFLETKMSIKKQYHKVYECITVSKEVGDMAPIYFKKALIESDEEWSMNKKLIDLSSKDTRRSVPKGGFASVTEDQHRFSHYFGKEIIGGMLDIEPRLWRKGFQESFEDQRKKTLQFAQWWKPYDFTKSKNC
uniref:Cwf19-like C-terminal domain-containing protein n=1 Tax=Cebus imitator TaxID=2715852 RepID=A0A2K5S824_CEBIM